MNNVVLTGRLTAAPDLKTTKGGKSVCEFTLAVDRETADKQTDFIRCEAWDKQAENLCKYKNKGDQIGVIGSLRVDKYTADKGETRYRNYVRVAKIEYLAIKATRDPENGQIHADDFPF